eukprot:11187884-Lingulodinium_polyedra.AAC.2
MKPWAPGRHGAVCGTCGPGAGAAASMPPVRWRASRCNAACNSSSSLELAIGSLPAIRAIAPGTAKTG